MNRTPPIRDEAAYEWGIRLEVAGQAELQVSPLRRKERASGRDDRVVVRTRFDEMTELWVGRVRSR